MSLTLQPEALASRQDTAALARLRAAFRTKPEVACVILLAAGLDIAAAVGGWWHLAGEAEPGFLLVCRFAALCLSFVSAAALINLDRRPLLLFVAAAAGTALPLLLLLLLATGDGRDLLTATLQQSQCERLAAGFSQTDFALGTAWFPHHLLVPAMITHNEYTVLDGLETASFFLQGGWYFCFGGGLLSLLCLWAWNGNAARQVAARPVRWLALGVLLLLALDFGRLALGYAFWNAARNDTAHGMSQQAVGDYQRSAFWDPRYNYDLLSRYEIGRLLGVLGQRDAPDYWAMVGDTWLVTDGGSPAEAYTIYRTHVPDPAASPELSTRYGNAAYVYGVFLFAETPASAVIVWQDGHSADPHNLEILYALALGETKLGRYDNAIVSWRLFLRDIDGIGIFQSKFVASSTYLRPLSAHAWSGLAWCYFKRGNYDAARQCTANSISASAVPSQ